MGSNKKWSKEEIEYLEESWGKETIKHIAKTLNRTESAVNLKAQRLKLGGLMAAGELLSICQLIKALGLFSSYSQTKKKFIDNGLPVTTKKIGNRKVVKVDLNKFWKWAEKNRQILNFAKFEKNSLGEEPSWVKEKRIADKSNPSKNDHNRLWSKSDDNLLISKTKAYRYTYKELAVEFNRTEAAIKRRLRDLGVPYRPIPLQNHIKWTEGENELLVDLHRRGYDSYAIARKLNKSHLSISDRVKIYAIK